MQKAGSLTRIRDEMLEGSIGLERLPSELYVVVNDSHYEKEVSKRYVEQGWEWLIRVAYGEWTQRLWIVQEQLLNKEITTLRRHRLIDWDAITAIPLLFAIGHLPQQYRDIGQRNLGEDLLPWDRVEQTLYGIWWDRHARSEPGTSSYTWSSLCHNLRWYQPLLCGDARDRVYAILAISQDAEYLGLKPDYSHLNTADGLSRQLSVRVLETAANLELLSFAFSWRRSESTLPSWCLTLDRPANINIPENIPVGVYAPHPKPYGFHLARAHSNNSILTVKGRILDYVSTLRSSIAWPHDGTSSQIEFFSSLLHHLPERFSVQEVASLIRTIGAKAPWSPSSGAHIGAHGTLSFHFWAYLRHKSLLVAKYAERSPAIVKEMLGRCDQILTKLRAWSTSDIAHSDMQTIDDTSSEHMANETVLRYALERGRCLGRTRAGRFCNATCTVQESDAIAVLQGADRLFIIRPVDNTYKLIGNIYVDGLMHGEAYENQDPDKVDHYIELA